MPGFNRVGAPDGDDEPGDRRPNCRPPARERGSHGTGTRGQTTFDFAIGISVFLSVMLFVFAFVPGILQPFELSGEQDTVIAERTASKLAQGTLGDPSQPYVLESHCTVAFFESGSPPTECRYDGNDLGERLVLEDYRQVNVTLEGTLQGTDGDLVCWDATTQDLVERGASACGDDGDDQLLATGGPPPVANDATVTSRRVVSLHGHNVTMKVVVW